MEEIGKYPEIYLVFFCYDGKGRFLLGKRASSDREEAGKWDIGSSHFSITENPLVVLRKKVMEEYGLVAVKHEYLGYREGEKIIEGRKVHWTGLDFKVLVNQNFLRNPDKNKIEAIMWTSLNNLPQNNESHSQLPAFFEKYKDVLSITR